MRAVNFRGASRRRGNRYRAAAVEGVGGFVVVNIGIKVTAGRGSGQADHFDTGIGDRTNSRCLVGEKLKTSAARAIGQNARNSAG